MTERNVIWIFFVIMNEKAINKKRIMKIITITNDACCSLVIVDFGRLLKFCFNCIGKIGVTWCWVREKERRRWIKKGGIKLCTKRYWRGVREKGAKKG